MRQTPDKNARKLALDGRAHQRLGAQRGQRRVDVGANAGEAALHRHQAGGQRRLVLVGHDHARKGQAAVLLAEFEDELHVPRRLQRLVELDEAEVVGQRKAAAADLGRSAHGREQLRARRHHARLAVDEDDVRGAREEGGDLSHGRSAPGDAERPHAAISVLDDLVHDEDVARARVGRQRGGDGLEARGRVVRELPPPTVMAPQTLPHVGKHRCGHHARVRRHACGCTAGDERAQHGRARRGGTCAVTGGRTAAGGSHAVAIAVAVAVDDAVAIDVGHSLGEQRLAHAVRARKCRRARHGGHHRLGVGVDVGVGDPSAGAAAAAAARKELAHGRQARGCRIGLDERLGVCHAQTADVVKAPCAGDGGADDDAVAMPARPAAAAASCKLEVAAEDARSRSRVSGALTQRYGRRVEGPCCRRWASRRGSAAVHGRRRCAAGEKALIDVAL